MQQGRALSPGTVVGDGWRIERVLGQGGFGITYEARHRGSHAHVALKEYLPFGYGTRISGTSAVESAPGEDGDVFRWGRERFMKEAETLARLDHPSIVQVWGYFEANHTAYTALAYEDGDTLGNWLRNLGRPVTQAELDRMLWPLTDALTQVHSLFLLHRDIKPDNIMPRADLTPVLIDFGTAKAALANQSHVVGTNPVAVRSLVVVSEGYAPPEQYAPQENLQGPWTDVYGLAATLYRAIAGAAPPAATARVVDDIYQPLAAKRLNGDWRPDFLAAVDRALALRRDQRPQSALEFRRALGLGSRAQVIAPPPAAAPPRHAIEGPSAPPAVLLRAPERPEPPPVQRRSRAGIAIALLSTALVLAAGAALYLNHLRIETQRQTTQAEPARKQEEQRLADEAARKKKEEEQRLADEAAQKKEDQQRAEETVRRKRAALANPSSLNETAPRLYNARFETSKGAFVIRVDRDFAPNGADRFFNLVKNGFYDDVRFFRVLPGFLVQFGINGDPAISARWQKAGIPDDLSRASNKLGFVSFVPTGITRSTQVLINLTDNSHLDRRYPPFGQVGFGMNVVHGLFGGYGEGAPKGPDQSRIQSEGNAYLIKNFPRLDFIIRATIEK